jgi:hypothetical protein
MKGYALSMEGRRRLIVSLEQTGLCAATLARSMQTEADLVDQLFNLNVQVHRSLIDVVLLDQLPDHNAPPNSAPSVGVRVL